MYPISKTKAINLQVHILNPHIPHPKKNHLQAINPLLTRSVEVFFHPRSEVGKIWKQDHGGKKLPVPKYAFRAYTNGERVRIFSDETETPESLLWLLLHELAHVELARSPFLHRVYRKLPKPKNYMTSDAAHEAAPEEQFANLVADEWYSAIVGHPCTYDRLWWRHRVHKMRKK